MDTSMIVGTVMVLIIGTIGLQIVQDVINNAAFSGTLDTVTSNIPVLFGVGLLVAAVGWAYHR